MEPRNVFIQFIFVFWDLMMLGFGTYDLIVGLKLKAKGKITGGEVIRKLRSGKVEIAFNTSDGQEHKYIESYSFTKGEKLLVVYDQQEPDNVRVNSLWRLYGFGILFIGLGGYAGGEPCVWLYKYFKRKLKIRYLRKFGRKVWVNFKEVETKELSKSKEYYIVTEYTDDYGKIWELKSEALLIDTDPTGFFYDQNLKAYIDYNNPEKYWIDTFDLK